MTFDLDLRPCDHMNIQRFPYYINKPNLVQIRLTFQMRLSLHFQPILQLDLRWPLTLVYDLWPHEHVWRFPYYINKPSLVPIWLQLFKMRPLSHFQPILQLDLKWPLTVICDFWPHQQMRVPMLHLWPNFVEIHQSMWKIEPNVNLFSQQQQQTTAHKVIPVVSFLLRQATQKGEGKCENLCHIIFCTQ